MSFFLVSSSIWGQKKLPNITLSDINNRFIKVDEIGKENLVIIAFWATWCAPCIEELDAINELIEEHPQKETFSFFAVSIDDNRTLQKVNPFVYSHDWDFEFLLDPNQELMKALNIVNIPYLIIVKNQQIVNEHSGYYPGYEDELMELINQLISEK